MIGEGDDDERVRMCSLYLQLMQPQKQSAMQKLSVLWWMRSRLVWKYCRASKGCAKIRLA